MSIQLREANGRFATTPHTEPTIELLALCGELADGADGMGSCDRCGDEVDLSGDPLCRSCQDRVCTECGQLTDDGEAYDGLCGNCADRQSSGYSATESI